MRTIHSLAALLVVCALFATLSQAQTVADVYRRPACTTEAIRGLSLQIIAQMNCLRPGALKSFEGVRHLRYDEGKVNPYLQSGATDQLINIGANAANTGRPLTIDIMSAIRTIPEQFLIYKWLSESASVGSCLRKNYPPSPIDRGDGLDVDIVQTSDAFRSTMFNFGFNSVAVDRFTGRVTTPAENHHYRYRGGEDIGDIDVRAFQTLWNINNPDAKLPAASMGQFDGITQARMLNSPASGFRKGWDCSETPVLPTSRPTSTPRPTPKPAVVPTSQMTLGPKGLRLLKAFEGFRANFYRDSANIRTIGYGHACHVHDCNNIRALREDGSEYQATEPLSPTEGQDVFRYDLKRSTYVKAVQQNVRVQLKQHEFDALVSFVFNNGQAAFRSSTLLKVINGGGSGAEVRAQLLRWVFVTHADGRRERIKGLENRREAEAKLYTTGVFRGLDWGSCVTDSGSRGDCMDVTDCEGRSFAGHCPGHNTIQCCVA